MPVDLDLRALAAEYERERPIYERVAEEVKHRMVDAAKVRGLPCTCTARAKEVVNLLKKALLKRYTDPSQQIRDKAAARIVVNSTRDFPLAETLIVETFRVSHRDDTSTRMKSNQLGYQGIHFEVQLPDSMRAEVSGQEHDLSQFVCEIQLQTRAQNLWNDLSHPVLYKPLQEAPDLIQRRIYRLVALMEIFDEEVAAIMNIIASLPGSDIAAMLGHLESHYLKLAGRDFNKELSFEILDSMKGLLDERESQDFRDVIDAFVSSRTHELIAMFDDREELVADNPLIFQPETIFLLQQMESDRFALRDRWSEHFPLQPLEDLAAVWGINLGD